MIVKNLLSTASRSALLSALETNGAGVRPGAERKQTMEAAIYAGYDAAIWQTAKLEAFQQGPSVTVSDATLSKALVVKGDVFGVGYDVSVDIIEPQSDGSIKYVAWINGDSVWVNVDDTDLVEGRYKIVAKLGDEEAIYAYNAASEWYELIEGTGFQSLPRTRGGLLRAAE